MNDRTRHPKDRNSDLGAVSSRLNEEMLADLESAINSDILSLQLAGNAAYRGLTAVVATRLSWIGSVDLERRLYSLSYLRDEVFSKYVTLSKEGAQSRREAAIKKWLLMESRNEKSNRRVLALPASICGMDTETILDKASEVVQSIIGHQPPEDILFGTFSGGASTSQKRGPGNIAAKFEAKADVTDDAWLEFSRYIEESDTWKSVGWHGEVNPRRVPGNVLFTVPKNSKIDRVAAKEPDLNMFAQKGIGNFIRNQLRKHGVDLNDQSVNQKLAREGSRTNFYATIDLSSASDTVCTSLVCRLLSPGWFVLLDRCRSRKTDVDRVQHELNMFSSMGNGFTFELESLIFYALMRSVAYLKRVRGRINVYGDDIIIPAPMFPMMHHVFSYFGFILNSEKSYGKGPFRESCGGHYYKGCDVTPFYVRRPIDHLSRVIHLLNNLTSWLERNDSDASEAYEAAGIPESAVNFPHLNQFWLRYSRLVDRQFRGGGRDWLHSINVLVSSDRPKSILKEVTKEVRVNDDGAYLYWLRIRNEPSRPQVSVDEDSDISTSRSSEIPLLGSGIWKRVGLTSDLVLSEALVTSRDVITLESEWVVRPYRDVAISVDPRK
jgi:hypothetical protein